jgi:hypothetical protein
MLKTYQRTREIAELQGRINELERERRELSLKSYLQRNCRVTETNKFPAKRRKEIMEKISQVKFGKLNWSKVYS